MGGGGGLARETTPEVGERDGAPGMQGGIGGVRLKVREETQFMRRAGGQAGGRAR